MADRESVEDIARAAGEMALGFFNSSGSLEFEAKSVLDFVSGADRAVESEIMRLVSQRFPEDGFVGEEGAEIRAGGRLWIVDPIDGTTNFMNGSDYWAVSIALVSDGKIEAGAVFAPARNEMFSGGRGEGAFLNGRRLARESPVRPAATIAVGSNDIWGIDDFLSVIGRFRADAVLDIRMLGSAALSLCEVARGVADAYYEKGIFCWDVAAGALIATETGAVTNDFLPAGDWRKPITILCARNPLYGKLERILG